MGKIVAEYDYYTLDQARKLVLEEMRLDREERQRRIEERKKLKRKELLYYAKQRTCGIIALMAGIVLIYLSGDITLPGPVMLFGLWMMFTRKKLL